MNINECNLIYQNILDLKTIHYNTHADPQGKLYLIDLVFKSSFNEPIVLHIHSTKRERDRNYKLINSLIK